MPAYVKSEGRLFGLIFRMVDAARRRDPLWFAHAAAYRLSAHLSSSSVHLFWVSEPRALNGIFCAFKSHKISLGLTVVEKLEARYGVSASIFLDGDIDVGTYRRYGCSVGAFSAHGALLFW